MSVFEPKILVELGVHTGNSYAAFCQAVKHHGTATRCFGIDTWTGDPQAGFYGEAVFEDFARWHDARYAGFSRLVRSPFDAAAAQFEPGSIDLLHIDGMHGYEAVQHDFATWQPLLSRRAIVLFHDTNVREPGFGVWRFWQDVSAGFPAVEFLHGHGLGVAAIGPDMPDALRPFFAAGQDREALQLLRRHFARLGEPLMRDILLATARQTLEEAGKARDGAAAAAAAARAERDDARATVLATQRDLEQARSERDALAARLSATEHARVAVEEAFQENQIERDRLAARLVVADRTLHYTQATLQAQLDAITNSTAWRATARLRAGLESAPALRRLLRRSARLAWWIVTLQAPQRLAEHWRRRRNGEAPAAMLPAASAAAAAEAPPAPLPQAGAVVPVRLRPEPLPPIARPAIGGAPRGTVLCLSHVAPFPPRAGNEYRIDRILGWLRTEGWRVVLIHCPLPGEEPSPEQLGRLASAYPDLVLVGRDGQLRYQFADPDAAPALLALGGRDSGDFAARLNEASPGDAARLLGLMRIFSPDPMLDVLLALDAALAPRAVLANYIFMTRGLPLLRPETLKIVDTHDVFSTKAKKVLAFGVRDDLAIDESEEGALLRRADVVLGIQPEESETLRGIAPGVRVLTVGVDMPMPTEPPATAAPVLLLVASDNPMNAKGLRDFLRFAWPRIRAAVPETRLDIVGSVGDALPREADGVRRLGRIDDLGAAYAAARVVINPAVAGTGLKIKTLEALAHLRPIVLWPSGVDGIAPELRSFCTPVQDWYAFGEATIGLLRDPEADAALRRGRARIAALLSAEAAYGPLREVLEGPSARQAAVSAQTS